MRHIGNTPIEGNEESIKNEKLFYSANLGFVDDNADELTLRVVDNLLNVCNNDEIMSGVIDTRVHMLKPGWNPAIPGWHCDGIPRDSDGQPNLYHKNIPNITHYLCVIDFNTNATTHFLNHNIGHLDRKDREKNLWADHANQIDFMIGKGVLDRLPVKSGLIYQFDAYDYHTSVPATAHGWRYFFRMSCNTHMVAHNEVRKQSQVYIETHNLGW